MSISSFLFGDAPSYDYSGYNKALDLINQNKASIDSYYTEAGRSLESQYATYSGTTMQDAVNALATRNVYSSPVSEVSLSRTRNKLADVYANAKANLESSKLSATTSVNTQLANYYTSLAGAQYQEAMNKYSAEASGIGALIGTGAALLAVL